MGTAILVASFVVGGMFGSILTFLFVNWIDPFVPPPHDKCPYCQGSGDYADVPVGYWLDLEDE